MTPDSLAALSFAVGQGFLVGALLARHVFRCERTKSQLLSILWLACWWFSGITRFFVQDDAPWSPSEFGRWMVSIGSFVLSSIAFWLVVQRYREMRTIGRMPGSTLRRVAEFLYSGRTVRTVLEPVLSDMQVEIFEALDKGQRLKARWVQLRGYWCFWSHAVLQLPASALARLWKLIA